MKKNNLLNEIDKTSAYIENIIHSENKGNLKELLSDLSKLKSQLINNSLVNNPLRGFPRKYAEMYNDYLHPLTDVLSNIENSVDNYLKDS